MTASSQELKSFLLSHSRFRVISEDSLTRFQRVAQRVVVDKGSYVQHLGSDAGSVFIVTQGVVEAITVLTTGEQHLLAFLHPGAILGLTAAFVPDRPLRQQNWVAHSGVVLWRIPISDFRQCAATDPLLMNLVLGALSSRIRWLIDEVASAAVLSAESKVIRCLLGVNEPPESTTGGCAHLLMVTHSKLALMLGLTRQSIAKVLRDLESKGLVRIERYRISVLSRSALEAYGMQCGGAPLVTACTA